MTQPGHHSIGLTTDLLRRYDVAGPRYTSYPTAPAWSDDFGPADYAALLARSNAPESDGGVRPLSLYSHLPFCERLCLFCGCNAVINPSHTQSDAYLATLKRDITAVAGHIDTARPVVQFHWGGGTPTYFTPEQLEDLFTHTAGHFPFAADAEIGVEIDPRVTTREHLETLRRLGFNRISLGVQDFDQAVQEAVNRIQPYELVRDQLAACRALGFESVSIDLIYGLPHQSTATFAPTLDAVIALNPDRVSLFNYGHVPWIKKYQAALTDALPSGEEKFAIFSMAIDALTGSDYTYVGMDHFAHPDDELCVAQANGTLHRNFQGYTTKAGADLLGFGVTSISELERSYAQNWRPMTNWREAVEAGTLPVMRGIELTDDDVIHRAAISAILCQTVLDKAEFNAAHGIDVDTYFTAALAQLAPLEADGLVELTDSAIRATDLGRIFLRNIAMPFDAYLGGDTDRPRFSRTL